MMGAPLTLVLADGVGGGVGAVGGADGGFSVLALGEIEGLSLIHISEPTRPY